MDQLHCRGGGQSRSQRAGRCKASGKRGATPATGESLFSAAVPSFIPTRTYTCPQYHKDGEYNPHVPRADHSTSPSRPRYAQSQGGYKLGESAHPVYETQTEYHGREPHRVAGGRDRALSRSSNVRPYPPITGGYPALFPERALPHEYATNPHGQQQGQGSSTGWQFR